MPSTEHAFRYSGIKIFSNWSGKSGNKNVSGREDDARTVAPEFMTDWETQRSQGSRSGDNLWNISEVIPSPFLFSAFPTRYPLYFGFGPWVCRVTKELVKHGVVWAPALHIHPCLILCASSPAAVTSRSIFYKNRRKVLSSLSSWHIGDSEGIAVNMGWESLSSIGQETFLKRSQHAEWESHWEMRGWLQMS